VDIAAEVGKHPFDVLCDLLIEEDARVLVFGALGEPEDELTERATFASIKDLMYLSAPTQFFWVSAGPHIFSTAAIPSSSAAMFAKKTC